MVSRAQSETFGAACTGLKTDISADRHLSRQTSQQTSQQKVSGESMNCLVWTSWRRLEFHNPFRDVRLAVKRPPKDPVESASQSAKPCRVCVRPELETSGRAAQSRLNFNATWQTTNQRRLHDLHHTAMD
ncbi:hypothetical protein RRG08_016879 [Elysia crispata]|uniref:Uncharacterized protein n=1 Tax=Elysia crispata TaxID=231223 RepID=A0AAE0XMI3_9GAST|nr:hypothetical protein RRG08_016879 [Elysia crispata]